MSQHLSKPSTEKVGAAIQLLERANVLALKPFVEQGTQKPAQSIYYWAADQLKGDPFSQEPFEVLSIAVGLAALTDKQTIQEVCLYYFLQAIANPITANLAMESFRRYLHPNDVWAFEALTELAGSKNDMASQAVFGLGILNNEKAVETLFKLARTNDKNVSHSAVVELAKRGDLRAVEILITKSKKRKWGDGELIHALGRLRTQDALPYLLELSQQFRAAKLSKYFHDEDEEKSYTFDSLLYAFGQIGGDAALDEARQWFEHENQSLREQAALALLDLGDTSGLGVLEAAAPARLSEFQWQAGRCLLRNKYPRGLEHMIEHYQTALNILPSRKRGNSDRANLIHSLRWDFDPSDLEFLNWVTQNDFDPTEQGWTLAEEARRTIDFIQAKVK
ncbi:MAG: hypothetical protein OHK003_10060 [Anaerolineales bacterium]